MAFKTLNEVVQKKLLMLVFLYLALKLVIFFCFVCMFFYTCVFVIFFIVQHCDC